jgi:predicted phosphodiesterase
MPADTDIRYVCLSDLHLGAELSLLTSLMPGTSPGSPQVDPKQASLVLVELMNCLRYLIKDQSPKPTLILLGDILELALANDNVAAMVFERFLELAMPAGEEPLFDKKIFYIPGNHDHHLWETDRETQYVSNYLPTHPQDPLEIPRHITKNIFMELVDDKNKVRSFFLNGLLQRYDNLKTSIIYTAYPNFGLIRGNRGVIFHHGHFIESIYLLMTTLKNLIFPAQKALTRTVDDLEAENFAWIDFFWSTLGRSGDWGKDVEIIYDKMQDEKQFRTLVENLATGLAAKAGISSTDLGGWLESKITKKIIDVLVDKLVYPECAQTEERLSVDAEQGLAAYVNGDDGNGPLRTQIFEDCVYWKLKFPEQTTFVFGHTHKPFEIPYKFSGYLGETVPVYNTGGWVVETQKTSPLHGGAVVLLNENLDVASLHLYNEADDPAKYQVKVSEVPQPGQGHSDFFNKLSELVKPDESPWGGFSDTVAKEVEVRRQILLDKIASQE